MFMNYRLKSKKKKMNYRGCELQIPKNLHSQWLKTNAIETGEKMQPGDLIFFFREGFKQRVTHVMMYLGNVELIDSIGFGLNSVKEIKEPKELTTIDRIF